MAKVDMTGDPQVAAAIKQLRSTAATLHQNRDSLRNVQQSRDSAVQSIDTLMQTMQGLV
jgi:Tfp pilus assembly protein PilN